MNNKREINDHIVSADESHKLKITVDNANRCYQISASDSGPTINQIILFQDGPVPEFGTNGVTNEVLLAIVIDQLRVSQSGQLACRENAIALTHIETALLWLQRRTLDRIRRGVEGTYKK